jgi:hypothetical protein
MVQNKWLCFCLSGFFCAYMYHIWFVFKSGQTWFLYQFFFNLMLAVTWVCAGKTPPPLGGPPNPYGWCIHWEVRFYFWFYLINGSQRGGAQKFFIPVQGPFLRFIFCEWQTPLPLTEQTLDVRANVGCQKTRWNASLTREGGAASKVKCFDAIPEFIY